MTDRDPYPSEKQDRFIVRLPDGMREWIKASAERNGRSMNSEIVARLQASFGMDTGTSDEEATIVITGNGSGKSTFVSFEQFVTEVADAIAKVQKNDSTPSSDKRGVARGLPRSLKK